MGNKTDELYLVQVGKPCKVLKRIIYNNEEWYLLRDMEGKEFYSLKKFWDKIIDIQSD